MNVSPMSDPAFLSNIPAVAFENNHGLITHLGPKMRLLMHISRKKKPPVSQNKPLNTSTNLQLKSSPRDPGSPSENGNGTFLRTR